MPSWDRINGLDLAVGATLEGYWLRFIFHPTVTFLSTAPYHLQLEHTLPNDLMTQTFASGSKPHRAP